MNLKKAVREFSMFLPGWKLDFCLVNSGAENGFYPVDQYKDLLTLRGY